MGILHALHAGAELLHALVELILLSGDGRDGAVVQALGAVAGQVFAQAQLVFALGVEGRVDDAGGVLAQGAAHQEPVVIHQRARQQLHLRHSGAGIAAAMGADGLALSVLKAVHAKIFVCHLLNPLWSIQSQSARGSAAAYAGSICPAGLVL